MLARIRGHADGAVGRGRGILFEIEDIIAVADLLTISL